MQKNKKIITLIDALNTLYPEAKTELYYENNFQLLIAILMSAQATDVQVNKVNKVFFKKLQEPADAKKIGLDTIENSISSISFFRNKARFIMQTSEILTQRYQGQVPETLEELIQLPGVGIKTAKVYLAVTKNAPYLGVDTHVHRVLNRIGIVHTKSPLETDKKADHVFSKLDIVALHNKLVLF